MSKIWAKSLKTWANSLQNPKISRQNPGYNGAQPLQKKIPFLKTTPKKVFMMYMGENL